MRLLATTALALTLVTPALAANDSAKPLTTIEAQQRGDIYASDLLGMRVYATEKDVAGKPHVSGQETEWDDIGEVDDVILSESGKVKAVILGVGGFLGIGERDIAVDMSSLNMVRESDDDDDFFLVVNANKDKLLKAPAYKRTAMTAPKADPNMADDDRADRKKPEMARKDDDPKHKMSKDGKDTDEPKSKAEDMREGYSTVPADNVTVDMLDGATAYGADNEEIGEVDEVVKTDEGKVDQVIIDVGGFLGVNERPVAFKLDQVEILREDDGDNVRVFVNETKSALEKKPKYEG